MKIKKISFIVFIIIFILCSLNAEEKTAKSKGLLMPSEELYTSFRKKLPKFGVSGAYLPESVDLSPYLPNPGHQGYQNSCVGWATAYALKTMHEKLERNWNIDTDKHIFSPAFIYNQINGGRDQGSYIHEALQLIVDMGCATLSTMSYSADDYRTSPSKKAYKEAAQYKGLNWFTVNDGSRWTDESFHLLKSTLAENNGVIIAMQIYDNFDDYSGGIYRKAYGDYSGYHAMCVVGYDDNKQAIKLINSWGERWGDGGYGWISYDAFKELVDYAYAMEDRVDTTPVSAPYPPDNVEASRGTYNDHIKITWNAADNADSYIIYRYRDELKEIGRTDQTYYLDKKADTANERYYYYVKSVNRSGESDYSETAIGYMSESKSITPGKPQNVYAEADGDYILLSWDNVKHASYYEVYRYNTTKNKYEKIGKTDEERYKDKIPAHGVTYWYVITAVNKKGQKGEYSDAYSITSENNKNKTLTIPGNFVVSEGIYSDKIIISWAKVNNADYYILYKWNEKREEWDVLDNPTGTSYTDTDVTSGGVYYYSVCAANDYSTGECTDFKKGYVKEESTQQAPATPSNLVVSEGTYSDKIEITWKTAKGADGYYIAKNYTPNGRDDYLEDYIWLGPVTGDTGFTDYDVENGYTYVYYVIAYNDYEYSEYSEAAYGWVKNTKGRNKLNKGKIKKAEVLEVHPDIPQNLTATQDTYTDRINLTWSSSEGADGYYLAKNYTKTGTDNYLEEFEWIGPLYETNYTDTDVKYGYDYLYYVISFNDLGYSDYSEYAEGWVK